MTLQVQKHVALAPRSVDVKVNVSYSNGLVLVSDVYFESYKCAKKLTVSRFNIDSRKDCFAVSSQLPLHARVSIGWTPSERVKSVLQARAHLSLAQCSGAQRVTGHR